MTQVLYQEHYLPPLAKTQLLNFFNERVVFNDDILQLEGRSCSAFSSIPLTVVYPENVFEVQTLTAIARENRLSLHPLSRGKNWGYGSRCAPEPNAIVVDLSLMNKIIEVNEELAYAVIQPGVSQEQLYQFLLENNHNLIMDATGASPGASIVGNLLERGFGQTNYGDRFLHSAGLEIVLPNGTLLKSGFGHYDAETAHLHKWGIGPSIDGIFTQSNFGIVVSAGIWLLRKPETTGVFIARMDSIAALGKCVESLREMKLAGRLPATVHIANDLRIISSFTQFPFDKLSDGKRLPEKKLQQLSQQWGMKRWNCIASVLGSDAEVALRKRELRRRLKPFSSCTFISDRIAKLIRPLAPIYNFLTKSDLNAKLAIIDLMKGKPTATPTKSTYWRKRQPAPSADLNPSRDGCGVIWCSPVFPSTAKAVTEVVSIVDTACIKNELETNISITLVSERSCCATIGLFFDNDSIEEQTRATQCYHQILDLLMEKKYVPYRFGADTSYASKHIFKTDSYWSFCKTLKSAIDPYNIISPGRYGLKSDYK